jgi:outer membrane protein
MHLFGKSVLQKQEVDAAGRSSQPAGNRLRAVAALMLALTTAVPSGFAQQAATTAPDKAASELPSAPAPAQTEPLDLRQSKRDFSVPSGRLLGNPLKAYVPTSIDKASFQNSVRLSDLVKNGKIYLSLSDALALALENNYDIAISRYYMDLADLDLMRARAGQFLQGSGATVNSFTQGGYSSSTPTGGGPGGATGGSAAGSAGLTLSASGAGPAPESYMDPSVTANLQFDRATQVSSSFFTGGSSTANTYDFAYNQGFVTGTAFQLGWNNKKSTSTNSTTTFSPEFDSSFKAQVTQHLLQGAGIWINKRFVYQAQNNRRITDSTFRQQILYTVNQVENIYWGLVNAYEDVQAKQQALEQSSKLSADNRKQLEIGTLAPLDVVNSDSAVASDKQALISSQSTLNYQQQIIKQAIARNLNDPALVAATIIPTDRVSIAEIPEETQSVDDLVQLAFKNSPVLEQAALALKNDAISLRGAKNGLLPTVDVFGYMSGAGVAGTVSPNLSCGFYKPGECPTSDASLAKNNAAVYTYVPATGYGSALDSSFNNSSPDKGFGFNVTIPIRNRTAQAEQAAALIQYRQAELRLEQLYTQIRMNVVNAQFALTNDRAQVQASIAGHDYAQQSLDAEVKKLRLGASTTAGVLLQQKNMANAQNSLLSAQAAYARDRAGLYQTLASTLEHYGINLQEAATGNISAAPVVPGLKPAKAGNEPVTPPAAQ